MGSHAFYQLGGEGQAGKLAQSQNTDGLCGQHERHQEQEGPGRWSCRRQHCNHGVPRWGAASIQPLPAYMVGCSLPEEYQKKPGSQGFPLVSQDRVRLGMSFKFVTLGQLELSKQCLTLPGQASSHTIGSVTGWQGRWAKTGYVREQETLFTAPLPLLDSSLQKSCDQKALIPRPGDGVWRTKPFHFKRSLVLLVQQ